jgi:hypothetical protein
MNETNSHGPFSLPILQAINDWQRGGDQKQKQRRGRKLKEECAWLPIQFTTATLACFRQIALLKGPVWNLMADEEINESISAWTINLEVAKEFKGGVPAQGQGYQGVIFCRNPKTANVVVNLVEVYRDKDFTQAIADMRSQIVGFADGIAKYAGTQDEVVLEVESMPQSDLYSFGGHSSAFEDLVQIAARQYFGREPTADELQSFFLKVESQRNQAGPNWLTLEATQRVLRKMEPHVNWLQHVKSLQAAADGRTP